MTTSFNPFPFLETTRLLLRRLSIADEQEVFNIRSRENEFVDRKRAVSLTDARDFIDLINTNVDTGEAITWAITLKPSTKLVGTVVFWNLSADRLTSEIGYELDPAWQGKGIMHEAVKKVIEYGFDTLKFQTIEAYTKKEHQRSLHLLNKFGFKPAPNLRNADPEVIYTLTRADLINDI